MREFNICKNALIYFNYHLTEDMYNSSVEKNVNVCKLKLNQAIRKAQQEFAWSFLIQGIVINIDNDCKFKMGYTNAFKLPDNLLRIISIKDTKNYRRINNHILCNESSIEVYGMIDELPSFIIPKDFEDLISIALAYLIAPIIAPGSADLVNQLIKQYSWTAEALMQSDLMNHSK